MKINKELDFEALLKIIKKEFKNTLGAEEVKILILKPHAIAEVMEEYSSVGLKFSKKSPIFKIKELVISNPKKGKGVLNCSDLVEILQFFQHSFSGCGLYFPPQGLA